MNTKNLAVLAILALALAGGAAAEGAGGTFMEIAQPDLRASFMPSAAMPYDLEYMGGYGYGVTDSGFIIGGFGAVVLDSGYATMNVDWGQPHLMGGMGGVILGARAVGMDSLHLDVAARLGLGGTYYHSAAPLADTGYVFAYAEPYVELGFGVFPWMHVSALLGYQVMGNVITGKAFTELFTRSTMVGLSVSFGDYRRPW